MTKLQKWKTDLWLPGGESGKLVWFPRVAHGVIEMHMLYLVVAGALTSHIINLPRSKKANTHPDVWMPREVTPESLG